jgi:hypothetical protein
MCHQLLAIMAFAAMALAANAAPLPPLLIRAQNNTWGFTAQWSASVEANSGAIALDPALAIAAGSNVSVVLGGRSDNDDGVITLSCPSIQEKISVRMAPSFSLTIGLWAFPELDSVCTLIVQNDSDMPLGTTLMLTVLQL